MKKKINTRRILELNVRCFFFFFLSGSGKEGLLVKFQVLKQAYSIPELIPQTKRLDFYKETKAN